MPRPAYRRASETTRRRLASSRWSLALLPSSATSSRSVLWPARSTPPPSASLSSANSPASIRLASSTSCPAVSSGTLPICPR